MWLGALAAALTVQIPLQAKAQENCRTMTESWFGAKEDTEKYRAGEDPLVRTLEDYFAEREKQYREPTEISVGYASARIRNRASAIKTLEERAGISITDAKVTTRYGEEDLVYQEDGTIAAYVYEWTFFDYDDLSDQTENIDVSGYGTYHKITLAETEDGYEILSDEYDESDILGICTMEESTIEELEAMDYEPVVIDAAVDEPENTRAKSLYTGYDPEKAVAYADKYVYKNAVSGQKNYEGYYNAAYYNYNKDGGDCANYTSQCISAGGMPQVVCDAFGNSGWYYKSANDRSSTWTSAKQLRIWMAANRGKELLATDDNVYMGSPVFYQQTSHHATICVGKNSAGVPIINSHNYDRYHVAWDYWDEGTIYRTVQLTDTNWAVAPPHVHSYTKNVVQEVSCTEVGITKYTCECGDSYLEKTMPGHTYGSWKVIEEPAVNYDGVKEKKCSVCGRVKKVVTQLWKDPSSENPFTDVKYSKYYCEPVLWAVGNQITSGDTETTFSPDGSCTRAQAVTFLWRANGSPKPETLENPFSDVSESAYYRDAVLWAMENGITKGAEGDQFYPDKTLTRAEFVTFLYRAEGQPQVTSEKDFSDVAPGRYYRNAVLWAVENDITSGVGNNQFQPNGLCTRAQVVTLIARTYR